MLRAGLAVLVGAAVSLGLALGGAIVVLLVAIGIPLGATPRPLTAGEYGALLLTAGLAAVLGGRLASGLARTRGAGVRVASAVTLAAVYLWGFWSPASHWPDWWAPAVSAVAAAGAFVGGVGTAKERRAG